MFAFAVEYAKAQDGIKAAVKAGYSEKSANHSSAKMLRNPLVIAEIAKQYQIIANAAKLTPKWVLDQLQTIVKRCMQSEPVYDSNGEPTGEYRFDSKGANTALGLIGKHLGMFTDRLELSGHVSVDQLTEEQRAERMVALLSRVRSRLPLQISGTIQDATVQADLPTNPSECSVDS